MQYDILFASIEEKKSLAKATNFEFNYTLPADNSLADSLLKEWPCLIVKKDSTFIAFCSLEIHPDYNNILWISTLAVLAEYQKQGIGKALIQKSIEHAKTLNCKDLRTWVHTVKAKGFWRNMGFRIISGVSWEVEGNSEIGVRVE